MISGLTNYMSKEVRPRLPSVVTNSSFLAALICGVGMGIFGDRLAIATIKLNDLFTGLLSYAAVAMGFCLAGLTVGLALPDSNFASYLKTNQVEGAPKDSFSNLLFVFSWTALIHWTLLLLALAWATFGSLGEELLGAAPSCSRRVLVSFSVFLLTYGVAQFLVAILTLSQLGDVWGTYLKKEFDKKNAADEVNVLTKK